MFKLDQSATYFWPVTITMAADGGRFVQELFDAEFARLQQSELEALRNSVMDGKLTDADMVRQVVKGWRGVSDRGVDLPFSSGALDRLLQVPNAAAGIVTAFLDSVRGEPRKN